MRSAIQDIEINKGSRFNPTFTWLDENGDPAFDENWKFIMDIRISKGSSALIHRLSSDEASVLTIPGSGIIRPDIKTSDTLTFDFEWAWYDLLAIPATGDENALRIAEGRVKLKDLVTRTGEISFDDTPILSFESATPTTLTFSYTNIDPAIGYEYRIGVGNPVDIGTDNPFTIEDLEDDTQYSVQIRGYDNVGFGPWSDPVIVSTEELEIVPPINAPTITDIETDDTSATVFYGGVSNADSYEYRLNGGTVINIGTTSPFTLEDLIPDTSYDIEMRARNEAGPGPWSAVTTFLTELSAPTEAPTIDSLTQGTEGVEIDYTGVDRATSYEFEVTPDGGSPIVQESADNPYTFTGLESGEDYSLRMRGKNNNGVGPWSNVVEFTTGEIPLTAPIIESVDNIDNKVGVTVTRSDVANSTGYEYRLDAGVIVDIENTNPFDITDETYDIVADESYNLEVRARNSFGPGPWSDVTVINIIDALDTFDETFDETFHPA